MIFVNNCSTTKMIKLLIPPKPLTFPLKISFVEKFLLSNIGPITQEEIAFEREIENCNDDAYAILLKLILRESFYRKRLGIIIEVIFFLFYLFTLLFTF